MPCESRVVILRDKQGRIKNIELVCEGVCTGGRCRKMLTDGRDATEAELQRYGIPRREGCTYVVNVQKCACRDQAGNVREERDEVQRCCQIVIKEFTEWTITENPMMSSYMIVKRIIECEKRAEGECAECRCERFKVKDSVHEVVDENGEVTGTAESVICRCL